MEKIIVTITGSTFVNDFTYLKFKIGEGFENELIVPGEVTEEEIEENIKKEVTRILTESTLGSLKESLISMEIIYS